MLPGKTIITTDTSLAEIKRIVRNEAIDEFAKALLSQDVVDKSVVRQVSEQLKAGVKNETD